MSLASLLPNYSLLRSQYLGPYESRYSQLISTLQALNVLKWYTSDTMNKVVYLYNPVTKQFRYKAQVIPIGSHDPRTNIWTWAWSSKFNKKTYGLKTEAANMNKLKKDMKNMAAGLVRSDQLRLGLIDAQAILKLIQAMSVASLNGMSTLRLSYPFEGKNVYVVIKRGKQITQAIQPHILSEIEGKPRRKRRSTKKRKSRKKRTSRKKRNSRKKRTSRKK